MGTKTAKPIIIKTQAAFTALVKKELDKLVTAQAKPRRSSTDTNLWIGNEDVETIFQCDINVVEALKNLSGQYKIKNIVKALFFKNISSVHEFKYHCDSAQFKGCVSFWDCTFQSLNVYNYDFGSCFLRTQIDHLELVGTAEFCDSTIHNFSYGDGSALKCERTTFGEKTKRSKRFIGTTQFSPSPNTKIEFFDCTFYASPNFTRDINHQTIFSRCSFHNFNHESIAHYRYLRSEMQRLNNEREAALFGSLEMQAYHKNELRKPKTANTLFEWILSHLYKGFNDYGRSLLRPIFWMIVILWGCASIYYGFDLLTVTDNEEALKKAPNWFLETISIDPEHGGSNIYWIKSSINMLGPVGFLTDNAVIQSTNIWGSLLIGTQRIASSIMWFLWILQVRKQFKL